MLRGPRRLAQIALACVCTTAFGRFVVPDVNMIPNGSIGSAGRPAHADDSAANRSSNRSVPPSPSPVTAIHFSVGAASTTIDANCGWVIAATHWALLAKNAISLVTDLVLVVTATAPRVAQARKARTISGQFSEWTSTLSPTASPRPASP